MVSGSSLYVGGNFTAYRGVANSANRLAKLDVTTGAIDTTFSPVGATANGLNGQVFALTVSGSSLYVGGNFTAYRGVANSANRLAKLNVATGAIDTTFSPVGATANGLNDQVLALATSGTSLYVGGTFTAYQGVASSANRLAKLDLTTGALDTAFSPPASNGFNSGFVKALAVSGSSLYVGGNFTTYRGVINSTNSLAKLDLTTGAPDTTFSPVGITANGFTSYYKTVNALAAGGSSLYVGGYFTDYRGGRHSANQLAKLDLTTGALDTTFRPSGSTANGFEGMVNAIIANGATLYIGGEFISYGGQSANHLAKFNATTWAVDTTFSPPSSNGFDDEVRALLLNGASLYVGGVFTDYRGITNSSNGLAKLDKTTGEIDTTFSPVGATANGFTSTTKTVNALAMNGSSLYVGGYFNDYRGVVNSANELAKLDPTTGAIDTTFSPVGAAANGFNARIEALAVSGSSLYVGGWFTSYKGVANSALRLAKLDLSTGAIDTTFSPVGAAANGFENPVRALAINGTALYVGGSFTAYKGVANSANSLAKLDPTTGAIDTTFSPVGLGANGFDDQAFSLVATGSALYVGGSFTAYKGVANSANSMAKLDPTTGAIDTTFSPVGATENGTGGYVYAFGVNGASLYVGGLFSSYRGTPAYYLLPVLLTSGEIGEE